MRNLRFNWVAASGNNHPPWPLRWRHSWLRSKITDWYKIPVPDLNSLFFHFAMKANSGRTFPAASGGAGTDSRRMGCGEGAWGGGRGLCSRSVSWAEHRGAGLSRVPWARRGGQSIFGPCFRASLRLWQPRVPDVPGIPLTQRSVRNHVYHSLKQWGFVSRLRRFRAPAHTSCFEILPQVSTRFSEEILDRVM